MLGRSLANEAAPPMGSVKSISNELFREYDKDRTGEITDAAIVQMLKDTYKLIETDFQPSYGPVYKLQLYFSYIALEFVNVRKLEYTALNV